MKRYYVTTAILYANAEPHVGHTFELIGADVLARAKRMLGYDVFFQTGTDEHGQKMLEYAERAGIPPREYADQVAPKHRELWTVLDCSFDRFIRTTDADHYAGVAEFWKRVRENGDIYKGKYEGWYCVTDETFVLEGQIKLGAEGQKLCPECNGVLTERSEESYFFRWSKYQEALEKYLADNPDFIAPQFRANEMINSFLKPGLQDISISRNSIKWGIPVPDDPEHVVYVWFDALLNYITGVGYGSDPERFAKWWPADVHVVGKDILKFHTLLWPAMCMSAGIAPPQRVFGHGFVSPRPVMSATGESGAELRDGIRYEIRRAGGSGPDGGGRAQVTVEVFNDGESLGTVDVPGASPAAISTAIIGKFGTDVARIEKMSKSKGNVVDPRHLTAKYGGNPDPLRYFLMREVAFGQDGLFSEESLDGRYTADLADKLGNLVARVLTMVEKYQGGMVVQPASYTDEDNAVRDTILSLFQRGQLPTESVVLEGAAHLAPTLYEQLIDECRFNFLLERIFAGIERLNQYITEQRPFSLAKDPMMSSRLAAILYVLCEGLRVIATQLYPFLPRTGAAIWRQLGCKEQLDRVPFERLRHWGYLNETKVSRGDNLFPKEATA